MRFLSNFGCKIIFMRSVNFWNQKDSNSLFKGSTDHVTSQCKWPIDIFFQNSRFTEIIRHQILIQTPLFLTRLPTRQDDVENRDKVYCCKVKFTASLKIGLQHSGDYKEIQSALGIVLLTSSKNFQFDAGTAETILKWQG